jgi:hypothetical protein
MRLLIGLSRQDLAGLQLHILVECWNRIITSNTRRNKYHKEFTERERATIGLYKRKADKWLLVTGFPEEVSMRPETLKLLEKAVRFFAENY